MRRSLVQMFGWVACALGLAAMASPAAAQTYPSRPIHFVVPYPAGGTSEVLARILAKKMGDSMGQSIIIENVGGASGTIGAGNVARSAPDGYTVLFGYSPQFTISPALMLNLPYDPLKSLVPIGSVAQFSFLITAYSKMPFDTIPELVTYAKAHPGKLTYASPGAGSSSNMISELFKLKQGLDIVHVPYRGGGPAIIDVIAGRVDLYVDAIGSLLPRVQSGAIKALAVSSSKRIPELPQVHTVTEYGMPELNQATWTGLWVPAGTPPEITKKLETELNKALQDKELQQVFAQNFFELAPGTPAQVTDRARSELEMWTGVVKATGMPMQ